MTDEFFIQQCLALEVGASASAGELTIHHYADSWLILPHNPTKKDVGIEIIEAAHLENFLRGKPFRARPVQAIINSIG